MKFFAESMSAHLELFGCLIREGEIEKPSVRLP